jgi:hypothetical protein
LQISLSKLKKCSYLQRKSLEINELGTKCDFPRLVNEK